MKKALSTSEQILRLLLFHFITYAMFIPIAEAEISILVMICSFRGDF
jgi:hypothetical protein